VAVQPAVELAPVVAVDRQPVDEIGVGGAADAAEQGKPAAQRVDPRAKAVPRPVSGRSNASIASLALAAAATNSGSGSASSVSRP
jgi:hypothetical protein